MTAPLILAGDRFKFLVATGATGRDKQDRFAYEFRCDCGAVIMSDAWYIRNDKRQSCGCQWRRSAAERLVTHGHGRAGKQTAEYRTWCGIKARCFNPNGGSFARYGARGITVCDRWRDDFEAFLADMGPRPSSGHSIDRIDNDGNYEPGNCRWVTGEKQARNKRSSRVVEYGGLRMSLADACQRAGVPYKRTHERLQKGWTAQRALAP